MRDHLHIIVHTLVGEAVNAVPGALGTPDAVEFPEEHERAAVVHDRKLFDLIMEVSTASKGI